MIKKFIQRVFGGAGSAKRAGKVAAKGAGKVGSAPRVYSQAEHGIDRRDISDAALRTCEGLQAAGYAAFVVGGAVRDLLLGRHPKDFDVATSATPEQVRGVFRRSRIIGRRFRIVHVMFGAETIEVTTFRGAAPEAEARVDVARDADADADADVAEETAAVEDSAEEMASRRRPRASVHDGRHARRRDSKVESTQTSHADEHGRLLRDNVFGNQEEDAIRRDFTMNALFYDPEREEVWDYAKGVADIQKKRVVMIGDPVERYREDPVRMLRAARLAGKLGFSIDSATEKPIAALAPLLENVPSARLFDEMLKLLLSGHSLLCIDKLRALGLHRQLLPVIDQLLRDEASRGFVTLALERTDARIAEDKGVSPSFLFAALFWFPMLKLQRAIEAKGVRPLQAMHEAMDDVLDEQRKTLAIPRRYDPMIKELWMAQPRFLQRSQGKAYRTLSHPRFRACYDFFELRAVAGDAPQDIADWWEHFQAVPEDERETMLLPDDEPKKKRRRKRKKPTGSGETAAVTPAVATPAADASDE